MLATPLLAVLLSGAFAALAAGAFAWTVWSTFRHGRPLCSWLAPGLWRVAALPLLLAVGLALVGASSTPDGTTALDAGAQALLVLGTALGTAAAVLARTVLVYADGVRGGTGRPLLRWADVSDFADKGRGQYVFFTYPRGTDRRRVDLAVPSSQRARFADVVAACVEARLNYNLHRDVAARRMPF